MGDKESFLSAGLDAYIFLWDQTGHRLLSMNVGQSDPIYGLAALDDGSFVTGTKSGGVHIWRAGMNGYQKETVAVRSGAHQKLVTCVEAIPGGSFATGNPTMSHKPEPSSVSNSNSILNSSFSPALNPSPVSVQL